MPKFPDSSKNYAGAPVSGPITPAGTTVFEQPATPSPGTQEPPSVTTNPTPPGQVSPTAPTPVVSDLPSSSVPPVSSSPFRNLIPLIIGIAAVALLAILGFTFLPKLFGGGVGGPVTLTYWGLWEPSSVMQGVIADYERDHPNVTIDYKMQSIKGYRSRVQTAITQGGGPDIIRIHNTWLPMFQKMLAPAPSSLGISLSGYYPVVAKNFSAAGQVYALPLTIDGLALYYNKDILSEAGVEPPTDWNALRKLAFDLTRRNAATGVIERAGAAIGTSNNIDHWPDILGLLILQNSGNPGTPSTQAVQDALTFYTIFATTDKSWDVSQPQSTYAFATGSVAMILAPSWRAAEIEAINPNLNYGIAPAPTLPTTNLAWATYWAEAVPVSSKNPEAAWEFLRYLSTPEVMQKLYAEQTKLRVIGEPYPLTSMASSLASDPLAAPFVNQGASYTSWYLAGHTADEGVNDQLIKYYEDAINAITGGSTVSSVLKTLDAGVAQVLAKYPEAK